MFLALFVAVCSVLLGAGLSFVPASARGALGYMRTFATLSAVAVVVTHLLPEALHDFGLLSWALFLAGWFAPAVAHRVGRQRAAGQTSSAVLEAGYWGLVIHHVADGVGLGTYTRLPAGRGPHGDVIVALAAHTVPLIAVVALAYRVKFGARSAVLRSLGLALASVLGIGLSSLVPAPVIARFAPAIAAVAAGLLLHVVTHDLTEDSPHSPLARSLDLAVAGLGVVVSLLGVWQSSDPGPRAFCHHVVELGERSSLVVLVALGAAAFSLRLPDSSGKVSRATRPAGVLGADSLLLSVASFGFFAAGVRLLAIGAGIALFGRDAEASFGASHSASFHAAFEMSTSPSRPVPAGFRARAADTLERSGPWLVLGVLVSALLRSVPASALAPRPAHGFDLVVLAGLANLTPVAAPAAVLIAAGLAALGFSSGAVLLFSILAPLVASLGLGARARLTLSLGCLVLALAFDYFALPVAPLEGAFSEGDLGYRAAFAVLALLLIGVWQRGVRPWLSTIVPPPPHEHEHAHDVHGPHSPGAGPPKRLE